MLVHTSFQTIAETIAEIFLIFTFLNNLLNFRKYINFTVINIYAH